MNVQQVIDQLRQRSDALHLEGMKRYAIDNSKALGVSMPQVRQLAKEIKRNIPCHLNYGQRVFMSAGYWLP